MNEREGEILAEILNLCERNPDAGLEFIENVIRKNPEATSDPFIKFAKAISYGSKGLFQLLRNKPSLDITGLNDAELRDILGVTDDHLDFLEKGLQEIREMDKIDQNALKIFGRQAELKVDAMAMVLERCRPGRVHEILGKTKLKYLGPERVFRHNECEVNREEFNVFIDIFFTCNVTPRSALFRRDGIDSKGRRYVTVVLYRKRKIFDQLGEQSPIAGFVYLYIDGTYTCGGTSLEE